MLDHLYGQAVLPSADSRRPHGFDLWEQLPPRSLSTLSTISAEHLKGFMTSVEAAWEVGNLLMARSTILWIVDVDGQIHFAVEEYVDGDDVTAINEDWYQDIPYHKTSDKYKPTLPKTSKLGHPSLVGCSAARIAGEIWLKPPSYELKSAWQINASSGRYGVWVKHGHRRIAHLQNVQYQFISHGIVLHIDRLGF